MKYYFTSEAVCMGHPDKVCDKISDYILDCALREDKNSRMAVEASIKGNMVFLYGEAMTKAKLDYKSLVHFVLKDIGYEEDYEVFVLISNQSEEIFRAVSQEEIKAGDQGIMFGYACLDTEEYMPLPIMLANRLCYQLDVLRKSGEAPFLKPDGKSQVTVEYVDGKPHRVEMIVMAVCHKKCISQSELKDYVRENVIKKVIPSQYLDEEIKILINTSGSFIFGGPEADSGTTGRKIVCDTYGGMARVGGGAFSSKDPSKVDRSGAYYARYVAKNIVANGLAEVCEIQVAYIIGRSNPVSLFIDTKGTNKVIMEELYQYVEEHYDFSVSNIIKELDLCKPIYYELASYGHFGRWDLNLSWEQIRKI